MRFLHDTPGTHLQSLLPSCHVHQTASISDAWGSDVIIRVAQSEEDYKDVGYHRSSLLLRLAALLRPPCRCCKFLFVCYCFFARCVVADDLCVMTKVNSLNTTTRTMTISVINSLVQVHINSGTPFIIQCCLFGTVHAGVCLCARARVCVRARACVYMRVYVRVRVCVCVCACLHARIHAYMHACKC